MSLARNAQGLFSDAVKRYPDEVPISLEQIKISPNLVKQIIRPGDEERRSDEKSHMCRRGPQYTGIASRSHGIAM